MKKLLWSIIILTLGLSLWLCGQSFTFSDVAFVGQGSAASAPAGCNSGDTTIPHDEFLEGFETATYGLNDGNNWTTNWAGTTANIDEYFDISSYTTGKPDYSCDHGLKVTVPNTTETYVEYDRGSEFDVDGTNVLITAHVYIDDMTLGSGENHAILQFDNAAAASTFYLTLGNDGSNNYLKIDASSDSAQATVSLDTWNKIEIRLGTTTSQCWFDLNDTMGETNVFTRYGSRDLRYLRVGAPSGVDSSDGGAVLYFDLLCVDKL